MPDLIMNWKVDKRRKIGGDYCDFITVTGRGEVQFDILIGCVGAAQAKCERN